MTELPTSIAPEMIDAICAVLGNGIVIGHLLGFSPSVPSGAVQGSQEHRAHLQELRSKFAWVCDLEGEKRYPTFTLDDGEKATVIEAVEHVSQSMFEEELYGLKEPTAEAKRKVEELMIWVDKAKGIYGSPKVEFAEEDQ